MKKLFLVILVIGLLATATPVLAINQGWGGNIDCLPSTQVWDGVAMRCKDLQDIFKRLYELEGIVTNLENKIGTLQVACNSQPLPVSGNDARIGALENRMNGLETALNYIQTTVVKAFATTIGLLQKLIK
jgi:hypothetical protein